MKQIISIIGLLIIGISASSLQPGIGLSCANLFCPSRCVEGIGCVELCGTILGLTCSDPNDICIDNPDDDCDPDKGGSDCEGYCVSGLTCDDLDCRDSDGCVEDVDGKGTPGCINVDDQCRRFSDCYPAPACANLDIQCPDGTCQGCCGCTWQFNAAGELACSWYRSCPAPKPTEEIGSTEEPGLPGDVCGSPDDGECGTCLAPCGVCPGYDWSDPDAELYGCCGLCYWNDYGQCGAYRPLSACPDMPSTTDIGSTDEPSMPGDICGKPPDDCNACRAQCGTCPDGSQWGCCGECYIAYDANGDKVCTGFKPRECPLTTEVPLTTEAPDTTTQDATTTEALTSTASATTQDVTTTEALTTTESATTTQDVTTTEALTTEAPDTTEAKTTDELSSGDICGSPPEDCGACRALCGLCPDGKTQWGCCGQCYISFDADGNKQCTGFKPRECPLTTEEPLTTPEETKTTIECDEYEYFTRCGTSCPRTCENKDDLIACDRKCNIGCFCKPGYVLDEEDGECIPEDECPMGSTDAPECPDVQVNPGDKCDYEGRCCWGEETCCGKTYDSYCCSCIGGIAACLNTDACLGAGILGCPSTTEEGCDENEYYTRCGTSCPKTCETKDDLIACNKRCNPGCFCKPGYVLDEEDGECIPEKECEMGSSSTEEPETTDEDTDVTVPCYGHLCGSNANTYGLIVAFGAIMTVFGWM